MGWFDFLTGKSSTAEKVVDGAIDGIDAESVQWVFKVLKEIVNDPFMIIIGFYFLAHVFGKARGS